MMSSMLTYREDKKYSIKIDIHQYDGLNGENSPVKVITPLNYRNKTIILYPGASPYAEKHPKIEMLGVSLAQNGYKVFIPRIPPLKRLDISEINKLKYNSIVSSKKYLNNHKGDIYVPIKDLEKKLKK